MQQAFNFSPSPHLARVSSRIAGAVLAFCRARVGQSFHMEELVAFIASELQIAPDSPSRILRDLRGRGLVDYLVENRRASRYRVTWVSQ